MAQPRRTAQQTVADRLALQLGRVPTQAEVARALRAVPADQWGTATGLRQTGQARAARAGREVRPMATATQRRVKRRVRKAKKATINWLAGLGLFMVILAIVMAAAAAFGAAGN